jgi:hypothetical protein
VASNESDSKRQLVGFFGLAFDGTDGHRRVTRSEHFLLVGGSQETHEHMQDTAVHFGEAHERTGKSLADTAVEEAVELLRKSMVR